MFLFASLKQNNLIYVDMYNFLEVFDTDEQVMHAWLSAAAFRIIVRASQGKCGERDKSEQC